MASANEAQAVKSLNTTPGLRNRRFVFKSCAQQIDELEINVFRNLETVKAKPSSGSYFFLDCLIHWRELNTAEDFISLYEELMPLVQTLSLALLHKDMIIKRLLSRLQMKARLSLEAIFRLIAELSRDLGEEFEPFLPRIIESYLALLKDKADREPEIIEQMYLTKDVVHVLKIYGRQSPSFLCIHTHGFVTYPAVLLHYTLSKWESKGKKLEQLALQARVGCS